MPLKIQYLDKTQYNHHKANKYQSIYQKIKKASIMKKSNNRKNKRKKRNLKKKKTMITFST